MFAVFSSVLTETFHVFGQLPSLFGISLYSLPEVYKSIVSHRIKDLISSLLLMGVMTCSHHVTPIFGMVFLLGTGGTTPIPKLILRKCLFHSYS
ncbi:MAG: hypothetical protein HRT68_06040 [Flavobacteriaceae bacterium]|nr:hypothetical protein [Flavobacteriaceae bacterium]